MKKLLNRKIIKKEVSLLHYLLLFTGKLFIGIGIGAIISAYALPFSFPIILIGVLILLPLTYYLFKAEKKKETELEKQLKKNTKKPK